MIALKDKKEEVLKMRTIKKLTLSKINNDIELAQFRAYDDTIVLIMYIAYIPLLF